MAFWSTFCAFQAAEKGRERDKGKGRRKKCHLFYTGMPDPKAKMAGDVRRGAQRDPDRADMSCSRTAGSRTGGEKRDKGKDTEK